MDNSPSDLVTLRSPYNGETIQMRFIPGVPPTLETMLQAKFELVEGDKPKSKSKQKETRDGTRETDGRQYPAEGL